MLKKSWSQLSQTVRIHGIPPFVAARSAYWTGEGMEKMRDNGGETLAALALSQTGLFRNAFFVWVDYATCA